MKRFAALTRVNLQMALYQLSLVRRRTGRREGHGFQSGLLIVVVAIMVYWGFWSRMLTNSFNQVGLPWLMLVIGMLIVSLLVMGLGLYSFNSLLFESADTDQLFAYPLPKLTVLAGKASGIVVENWIIGLVFWLPMVAVYGYYAHPGPLFYLFALLTLLVLPGIPLFILALISYLVGLLASGGRWRKILQVVLTLGFMVAIGVGLRQAVAHLMATARLQGGAGTLQDQFFAMLQHYYPPVGYAIHALVTGSWWAMGLAVLWNVVPLVLIGVLIAASYSWIRSRITTVTRVTRGHLTYGTTTAARALYDKELGRLLGSPMYLLNSCIGAVLTILFAFLFSINTGKNAEAMQQALQQLGITMMPIVLVAFMFLLAIANTTSPSISLEGQNLWIVQSLPLDAKQILRAKLLVHLTIIPPILLISCVLTIFTAHLTVAEAFTVFLPCLLFTIVSACLGLVYNLHYHRFDFYNDMQVVKNGASVLLTYGTMALTMAAATFGYWAITHWGTMNFPLYWGAWLVVFAVAAVLLYRYLMTKGVAIFRSISD